MASRLLSQARKHAVAHTQRSLHTLSAVRPASTSVRLAVAATAPLQQTRVATLQSCRCFSTESNASTSSNGKDTATPSNGNGAAAAASSNGPAVDVAKLQAEHAKALEEKEAKIKELNDRYMHALAESQNTLTRSMTQVNDAKKFAVQSFAKQLLEVADVLEIATKAAEDQAKVATDPAFKNLHEGMTMTHKVLLQIFERNGLKKFEPLNEKFDPYFHDGLLQLEDPTKIPGTVGLVLKSGYKLHDRCLRAAQVGTVKAPSKPPASE